MERRQSHGLPTLAALKLWLEQSTGIYELIPAFCGSTLVIVLASLATTSPRGRDSGSPSEERRFP